MKMISYKAKEYPYNILLSANNNIEIYPYLRFPNGDRQMFCVSPIHGRSYIITRNDNGRYVISKGNGLSYTQLAFLHTGEMGSDTWGLLLRRDAIRDFTLGQEIALLGIKTNEMECVVELEHEIQLTTGHVLKPVLLQYTVECPYRICDAPFMNASQIWKQVMRWEKLNHKSFDDAYLVAANVLVRNLRVLHDNEILHNAIHAQNYTWALELLDFEIACSPLHPYDRADDQRHVKDLFSREVVQTYEIINYIASALREDIDFKEVDDLFKEYDFDLSEFGIMNN